MPSRVQQQPEILVTPHARAHYIERVHHGASPAQAQTAIQALLAEPLFHVPCQAGSLELYGGLNSHGHPFIVGADPPGSDQPSFLLARTCGNWYWWKETRPAWRSMGYVEKKHGHALVLDSSASSGLVRYPALLPFEERYQGIAYEPLSITAVMVPGARIAGYDALNLDGLLSWCVVHQATRGQMLPDSDRPYAQPVPLRCLWRSPQGLPLWASTCFLPDGDVIEDVEMWHKRVQTGQFSANWRKVGGEMVKTLMSLKTVAGRWMERRSPLPTRLCPRWTAYCFGNPREIGCLLDQCFCVGKRRSVGFGEVLEWHIGRLPDEVSVPDLFVQDGQTTRPLPADAKGLIAPFEPTEPPQVCAYSPPYWKPSVSEPAWPMGTRVAVDWFGAVDGPGGAVVV